MDDIKWNGKLYSKVFLCFSFIFIIIITMISFNQLKNDYILSKYATIGYISSQNIEISDDYLKSLLVDDTDSKYIDLGESYLDKAGYYNISKKILSEHFVSLFYTWLLPIILIFLISCVYLHKVQNKYKNLFSKLEQWFTLIDPISPILITNNIKNKSIALLIDAINKKVINCRQIIENLRKENEKASSYVDDVLHQLKTPLAVLELIIERVTINEENPKKLQKLNDASLQINKMSSIIIDILRLSRLKSGKVIFHIKECEFNKSISEVIQTITPLAQEKNVTIRCSIKDNTYFEFDEMWLTECILNITKNCLEYSPKNSSIEITYHKNHHHHIITIQDEGVGIDVGDEELIFNRFYSKDTSNSKDNIGIGLNLSKEIVMYHHGKLWAENNETSGVTFTIILPVLSGEEIYHAIKIV